MGTETETAGVRHNQTSIYASFIDVSGTLLGFGGPDVNKINQMQPLPSQLSQACREDPSEPLQIVCWVQCWGSPGGPSAEGPAASVGDVRGWVPPRVRKIPWRGRSPAFLPRESHGQRRLVGYMGLQRVGHD